MRKGINEITGIATRIKKMDFSKRAHQFSDDEIGELANSFNQMIDDLKKSLDDLKKEIYEREKAQKNAISLSRLTGMADVASSVLHNIGNTLNSIKVSVSMMNQKLSNSEMRNLAKLADLLQKNVDKLAEFLVEDERGKNIPKFLSALSEEWEAEKKFYISEINSLEKNIDQISNILKKQQVLSQQAGVIEEILVTEIIEDSLMLNIISAKHAKIEIIWDFKPIKKVYTDRMKLFQIILNLIQNSIESLEKSKCSNRQLTLSLLEKSDTDFVVQINDLLKYFAVEKLGLNQNVIDGILQEFHQIIPECRKLIGVSFLSQQMQEKYIELLDQRCKRFNFFD